MASNSKGFFTASVIFSIIIVVVIGVSAFLSPGPLLFSEDFENATRNQQYTPCQAFTIVDGRLRVTIENSYSGCAVQLPNGYEEFVFTAYVRPVGDVQDGSINIIFGQAGDHSYEVQYRPEKEQVNFIETAKNANREKAVVFTTGWLNVPGTPFNDSENKIKLVVTRRSFDFWINDVEFFRYMSSADLPYFKGTISVGAGAGKKVVSRSSSIISKYAN
jgi:hypothetical protein